MNRLILLTSGAGAELQPLLAAIADGTLANTTLALVASNRGAALGLQRAKEAGIPTLYLPLRPFTGAGLGRQSYDAELADKLKDFAPDLIVLAGWMHVFSSSFLDRFPMRVINLSSAPAGQIAGVDGVKRTFESFRAGDATHGGCHVHYVQAGTDPQLELVIAETVVPIGEDDTLDTFETRIHAAEQRLLVKAIKKVLEGNVLPPRAELPALPPGMTS